MTLSPREKDVVVGLWAGLTNPEIGKRIGCRPRTVKAHMAKMMIKLDIPEDKHKRICLAVQTHEDRHVLGVRCPSCD